MTSEAEAQIKLYRNKMQHKKDERRQESQLSF